MQQTDPLIQIGESTGTSFSTGGQVPYYLILVFDGQATFSVDFTTYQCTGQTILFLSPYQHLTWADPTHTNLLVVRFHGDFYCIEYHKKEVACNGILFNNIYQQPFVSVQDDIYREVWDTIVKMRQQLEAVESRFDESIIRTYLQLILALSSREKQHQMDVPIVPESGFQNITHFQEILNQNFRKSKEVAFYAEQSGMAVNTFSKKIKRHFGKTPTKLIQERITLEAKKLLHLTHKPVKEIAFELNFEDEFYFSRYFKKEVGVSPSHFRDKVGISIVAK